MEDDVAIFKLKAGSAWITIEAGEGSISIEDTGAGEAIILSQDELPMFIAALNAAVLVMDREKAYQEEMRRIDAEFAMAGAK